VLLAGFSSLISSRVISLSCGNKSPMELVSSSKNCAQHLVGNPSYRMLYFLPSTPSIRLCLSKSQLAISSSMLFSAYKLMTIRSVMLLPDAVYLIDVSQFFWQDFTVFKVDNCISYLHVPNLFT
jgi:hypothetical protein